MMRVLLPGFVVALLALPVIAQAQIFPGEYISGTDSSVLYVNGDNSGALKFEIDVVGGNFHTCNLSGVIRNGEARMEDSADEKLPCIVTFKPQKDGIAVESKHGRACSAYCGMRASFEGTYTRPPAGCTPSEVRRARNRFKASYDKKQYAEARALLTPIASQCYGTLGIYSQGWVSNDLAITHYRGGNYAACRNTLQPWLELAQTPDDTIKGGYPPSDAEEMHRIAVATRVNMKLCGAPVTIGAKPKQ